MQDETNRCFHQADRDRRAFHKEVEHSFHEMKGKIMNHFNLAQQYEEAVPELGREVTMKSDKQSWRDGCSPARTNDHGRGVDELRADLEATKERYETEIKNLKRRVIVLEQKVLPSSTENK